MHCQKKIWENWSILRVSSPSHPPTLSSTNGLSCQCPIVISLLALDWCVLLDCVVTELATERDKFMSAVEAQEFGIVDHVLSHQTDGSKDENQNTS